MEKLDQKSREQRETTIVEQYDGIYPVFLAFYVHSIRYAAERSEAAFQRFDELDATSDSAALLVATVQEALTHAAALSRFFWPVKKDDRLSAARGRQLRRAYGLKDDSPLRSRKFRNAFEHFDEALDKFLIEDRVGYFFPDPLVGDCDLTDESIGHIFKLVDPQRGICVLLGEKFEFRPIRLEVKQILAGGRQKDGNDARR